MSKPKILIADNIESVARTHAEYLELHGYRVQCVFTPEECQRLLEEERFHLAILDLRMRDDLDEKDISGFTLAQQSNPRIPKILLTAFPTWEMARASLRMDESGLPPTVDFASKLEEMPILLQRVQNVLSKRFSMNWELKLEWKARDHFSLARMIEPDLSDERLLDRAEELEDLFRKLYAQSDRIRIDDLLWHDRRRVAVKIISFAKDKSPETMLVVCGPVADLSEETRRYQTHAPKSYKSNATHLHSSAETSRFAANVYALAGCDFDQTHSLFDWYRTDSAKTFVAALNTLCEQTLLDWRQENRLLAESQTLDELYSAKLGIDAAQTVLAERMRSMERQVAALGLKIERSNDLFTLRLNGSSVTYPDPVQMVYRKTMIGSPALLINAPGSLSGNNILADSMGQVWLTDFASAGLAPLFWNHVALESAIRYDWGEFVSTAELFDLETCLVEGNFSKFKVGDFEPAIRKQLRAIQELRRLAPRETAQDLPAYHLGMFHQAISRLIQFPNVSQLTKGELLRLAHLLISTAMIARLLGAENKTADTSLSSVTGLELDEKNFSALIDGNPVRLTEQGFKLLRFLYGRANQICTRREIVEQVFGYDFDENDESQEALVNTAISRLRTEIEPDPKRPRFLRNERGRGYRLVIEPAAKPQR
jgi:DNA-binding response OmpR family regulator